MQHEEMMNLIRSDIEIIKRGEKIKYLASSGRVSMTFLRIELALYWQSYMAENGLGLIVCDLTDYDWETNYANIKLHDTSTKEGMAGLFKEFKPEVLH